MKEIAVAIAYPHNSSLCNDKPAPDLGYRMNDLLHNKR